MSDEMQMHLDGLTERNLAKGMSPKKARYAAMREFGGVEQIKERARDERGWVWLGNLWRDLRFSFRSLRRAMAFSLAVIATLVLCIGANTTIFSVLYGMVLKPLPFHEAEQIVGIHNSTTKSGQKRQRVSTSQYLDYKVHADLLEHVAIWQGWMFNINGDETTDRLIGMMVTADYFDVLGIEPLLGRFFSEKECEAGRDAVVVLTQSFWETHFSGDPSVLGSRIRLSRREYTIIGVAPRSMEEIGAAPVLMRPYVWPDRYNAPKHRLTGMANMWARVKSGVAHGAALAQLQTLEDHFRESVADPALKGFLAEGGHRMGLGQLRAEQTKSIKKGLLLLQAAALLVLLLGCVNVSSLMLARVNTRWSELLIRRALGAGRTALARQLILESLLLVVTGAMLALILSSVSLQVINVYTAKIIFGSQPVVIDREVLGLTLVASLVIAVFIGVLPVLRIWRTSGSQASFSSTSRGGSAGGGIRTTSSVLVITQVALALILLIGAGLLIRSFGKVMKVNPGFDAERIIHLRIAPDSSYKDLDSVKAVHRRFLERLREIPGVEFVAYSSFMPGYIGLRPTTFPLRSMTAGKDSTYPVAIPLGVSPEFFRTMGIRLLEGRNFTGADVEPNARRVLIADRRFAEQYFPEGNAVGQLFASEEKDQDPDSMPMIVGVAEVAKFSGLDSRSDPPYLYMASQLGFSFELRTSRTLSDLLPVIRSQLREVDPELPIYQVQTMQMHLDDMGANRRGVMWLLGVFAGIALILAAVGLYGMLAYDVTSRTREIGIRGAIGATREQIVTLVLRQGLLKTGLGVAIGISGALILSRYLESSLYEVDARDPLVFIGGAAVLIVVALLACWLPARRAAKVDPMEALRAE